MWAALNLALLSAALCGFASAAAAASPTPPLPTLADFNRLPDVRSMQLSPSGRKLMMVRASADGREYLVEIRETAKLDRDGVVFGAAPAEVREAAWLSDDSILVTLRQRVKTSRTSFWGNFHAVFDDKGKLQRSLPSHSATVLATRTDRPDEIILQYDSTGDRAPDIHRFNVRTGAVERILRGEPRRFGYLVDAAGDVRISARFNPDNFDVEYFARPKGGDTEAGAAWKPLVKIDALNRKLFRPLGFFTGNPDELVVLAHRDSDRAGLYVLNVATGEYGRTVYEHPDVDIDDAAVDAQGRMIGARYALERPYTVYFDTARQAVEAQLAPHLPDRHLGIGARTPAGFTLVRATGPSDPGSWYLLDAAANVKRLAGAHPELEGKALARHSFGHFKARDGMKLPLFVSRPADAKVPRPLVVMPHGGPWARDFGTYDDFTELMVAQGYVVARPQFRGTRGFGRALWLAGDREWGGKMQDDLDDTVKHLVAEGIADPKRVAMFGWSYGGYAAAAASIRPNSLYRCAIAGAAVTDLDRINAGLGEEFALRLIQKPTIAGLNPMKQFKSATIPLFLIHGEIDEIVPVDHGRDAAQALKAAGKPHEYIEVAGLDHTSDRFTAEHKAIVYGAVAKWLGGPCGLSAAVD